MHIVTNGRESELSVVLREALWAYIEYKRIPPNPRLGAMTIIPLTPPLKCNVNAMTLHLESELSTRLKRNKKKIHPSLKS